MWINNIILLVYRGSNEWFYLICVKLDSRNFVNEIKYYVLLNEFRVFRGEIWVLVYSK